MTIALRRGLVLCALTTVALAGLPAARAQEAPRAEERRVLRGMHDQIKFQRDVARVAVGDQTVLSAETLNTRTILLLGRESGRTSLLVWFADDTFESYFITVQPDLRNAAAFRRSRFRFRSIFACHIALSLARQSGNRKPCQNDPSTKTTTRSRGNTTSGRPGRSVGCFLNRRPSR